MRDGLRVKGFLVHVPRLLRRHGGRQVSVARDFVGRRRPRRAAACLWVGRRTSVALLTALHALLACATHRPQPALPPAPMRSPMPQLLLLLGAASASVNIECHIFDETMVCDNEKWRLHTAPDQDVLWMSTESLP